MDCSHCFAGFLILCCLGVAATNILTGMFFLESENILVLVDINETVSEVDSEALSNQVLRGIDIESKVTSEIVTTQELPDSDIATIETKVDSVPVPKNVELLLQCKKDTTEMFQLAEFQAANKAFSNFHNTYKIDYETSPTSSFSKLTYSNGPEKIIEQKTCSDAGGLFVEARHPFTCSSSDSNNRLAFRAIIGDADCIANTEACRALGDDYAVEWWNDYVVRQVPGGKKCSYDHIESNSETEPKFLYKEMADSDSTYQQCRNDRLQMLTDNPDLSRADYNFRHTYTLVSGATPTSMVTTMTYSSKAEKMIYQNSCYDTGGFFVEAPKPLSCTMVLPDQKLRVKTRNGVGYCIADTEACKSIGADYILEGFNDLYAKREGGKCSYDDDGRDKEHSHNGLRGAVEIIQLSSK